MFPLKFKHSFISVLYDLISSVDILMTKDKRILTTKTYGYWSEMFKNQPMTCYKQT